MSRGCVFTDRRSRRIYDEVESSYASCEDYAEAFRLRVWEDLGL